MSGAPSSGGYEREPKVAIPRLDRGPPPPPKPKPSTRNKDDRVLRACRTCRKRKIKCSGGGPPCSACQASSLECAYEQTRRHRLREATQHVAELGALLRDLRGRVSSNDQAKIDSALAKLVDFASQVPDATQTSSQRGLHRSDSDEEGPNKLAKTDISGAAGSDDALDHFEEHGQTDYYGKNSEVRWLESIQRQTVDSDADQSGQSSRRPGSISNAIPGGINDLHEQRKQTLQHVPHDHINSSTFYLDSDELTSNLDVDIDAIPQSDVAQRLFTCYTDTVHPSFRLVNDSFLQEFYQFMNGRDAKVEFSPVWRAQLNLIFAISTVYLHVTNANGAADAGNHINYLERALALFQMDETLIVPNLQVRVVQATGALAFYFLAIGHVSRAWLAIGRSLRLAIALGLHLRNDNLNTTGQAKEEHVRLWWTLHSIECLISTITGRPPVLAIKDATVPLPRSLEGLPSTGIVETSRGPLGNTNLGSRTRAPNATESHISPLQDHKYSVDHVNLMRISQKVLLDLYAPGIASQTWQVTQTSISHLLKTLDMWNKTVSSDILVASRRQKKPDIDRLQRLLAIEHWSIKMVITRPCLCRTESKKHQGNDSAQFDISTARSCVESALEMTRLFSDTGDLNFIGANYPWWATTHYVVQAIAVLLLATTFDMKSHGKTMPEKISAIRKMIRWLCYLEGSDPVAAKAYRVVRRIIQSFTPRLQVVVDELLEPEQDLNNDPAQNQPYQHTDHIPQWKREGYPSYDQSQTNYSASATFDPQTFDHDHEMTGTMPFPSDMMFDSEAFLQGSHGRGFALSYNDVIDPGLCYGNQIPIGNTFLTNFDQDAPFADLQDLWAQPSAPDANDSN